MDKTIESYKGYSIEINPVPREQFDFDDFGWAFQVSRTDRLGFQLVIKSVNSTHTEDNSSKVLLWGRQTIRGYLDSENFENGKCYCFKWVDVVNSSTPTETDCEGFLL